MIFRKKYKNANELYLHCCAVHCPRLEGNPDIYCQWGIGMCDTLPRKRFSLMTHIFDRHCTNEALNVAVQRRVAAEGSSTVKQVCPVTLIRATPGAGNDGTPGAHLKNGPTTIQNAGSSAMHAIKRHAIDFMNAKELMVNIFAFYQLNWVLI